MVPFGPGSHVVLEPILACTLPLQSCFSSTFISCSGSNQLLLRKRKEKKAWQTSRNLLLLVCYAFYGPFLNAAKPQPLALSDCFWEPGQTSYLGAIFVLNTVFNLFWNKARNPLKLKTMNYFSPF